MAVAKGIWSSWTRSAPRPGEPAGLRDLPAARRNWPNRSPNPPGPSCPKRSPRNWLRSMSSAREAARPAPGPPAPGDQVQVWAPCGAAGAHRLERTAVAVVHFPLFGIVQHVEGGLHLLELLLGRLVVGVHVGVVFPRQLPIGLLNFGLRGVFRHPQGLVIVLSHRASFHCQACDRRTRGFHQADLELPQGGAAAC